MTQEMINSFYQQYGLMSGYMVPVHMHGTIPAANYATTTTNSSILNDECSDKSLNTNSLND